MVMAEELKSLMLGAIKHSGQKTKMISTIKLRNHGLLHRMMETQNQMLVHIQVIIIMRRLRSTLLTLMECQVSMSQGRNHSGTMAMLEVLRSLMLMVILLLGALVRMISIRNLNSHGLHQLTKVIRHQRLILLVSL